MSARLALSEISTEYILVTRLATFSSEFDANAEKVFTGPYGSGDFQVDIGVWCFRIGVGLGLYASWVSNPWALTLRPSREVASEGSLEAKKAEIASSLSADPLFWKKSGSRTVFE